MLAILNFDDGKDIAWIFTVITLIYNINPLIFPSTIVRSSANNKKINNNPANRKAGIKNNHWLEHLLHLNEPNTTLNSGTHSPHAIPPLL